MNHVKLPVMIVFILSSLFASAQIFRCGTELTGDQQMSELALTDSITSVFEINRTLHITLFIVKDASGETDVNMAEFSGALIGLNSAFSEIALNFELSSVRYIENYHFNSLKKNENESDMIAQNFVINTINVYLVSYLYDGNDQEVCGYTYYPAEGKDIIMLSKSCIAEEFLIEQFGHFFNLYHTHERGFAEELADGSNCVTAGDLCCDTPADPDLAGKVTPDCQYASLVRDANNDYYTPSVFNYMSFSPGECNKCYFSSEQYVRILNCLLLTKSHLR
jgi:hypothetical protein